MGIKTRRGAVALVAAAATLGLAAPMASAAPSDAYRDHDDHAMDQQYRVQSNFSNTQHLFRVAGPSRINTAIRLMNSSDHPWSNAVVIARDDDFADALASGPYADVIDAPILLSAPGDAIDARTVAAIKARGFSTVIFIGGTGVFSEQARASLLAESGINEVHRVRGVDRYETAVNIARDTAAALDNEGVLDERSVNVYLATGMDFPDALAAGAAAADNDGIVLLSKGTELERFTYEFLVDQRDTEMNPWNHIELHTVGGQAETAAKSRIENVRYTNTGKNRYETAAMLASKFKNPIEKIVVTSGENYPDGVVSGAWVANHDGALLLTRNASLSPETAAFLSHERWAAGNTDIVVVGGTGSVSQTVSDQLAAMMTW